MTFNEKGLLKAMKRAYREYGYTVAQTETGLLIRHLEQMQFIAGGSDA